MRLQKDMQKLAKKAQKQGWTVELTNGGHVKWTSPLGEKVYGPYSPSDIRSMRNVVKRLKHKGLHV